MHGLIEEPKKSNENVTYYGTIEEFSKLKISGSFDEDEQYIFHNSDFEDQRWRDQVYGIKKITLTNPFVYQKNVTSYMKRLNWRNFLVIKDQFLGGIKDDKEDIRTKKYLFIKK
jgi:hypothetical protein